MIQRSFDVNINKEKVERCVIIFVLTILPLLTCYIVCMKSGIRISEVYIPNSLWNDEILYYKITASFNEYSKPLGYFGYNESFSQMGHMGPWSPFLFVFYALYAKLFGWSLMSPIFCNILMMSLAMFVFACMVRPSKRQTVYVFIMYFTNLYFTRYVLSVMSETYIYALLLVFFSVSVKLFKCGKGHSVAYAMLLNVLAVLLTLSRPYYILLFCIPGYYFFKRHKNKFTIFAQMLISFICIITYFLVTKYFCAEYWKAIVKTDWLELIFSSPVEGIRNFLKIFVVSVYSVLNYVGEGFVTGNVEGGIWALYLAAIIWMIYRLAKCDKEKKIFWGYFVGYAAVMMLAVFYLYDIRVGSRHLASFVLLFIFMISVYEKSGKIYAYLAVLFLWIFCIRANDAYIYNIPSYTSEKADALSQGYDMMTSFGVIDEQSDNAWDNTIIWLYSDTKNIDFTYLYAVPDGMGINLCRKSFVKLNFNNLKSKYIFTGIDGEIDSLCAERGKELIAEYGNAHVWKLR